MKCLVVGVGGRSQMGVVVEIGGLKFVALLFLFVSEL